MINIVKMIIKKILFREKSSSDSYINHLRKKGMSIGEGTVFFHVRTIFIDETRPWMIKIGNNVKITKGVTILTHGFDWAVLKGVYGDILGSSGAVSIGDNVFIGMNTIILKGTNIGNNVIIGAGSIVNKDIPDNTVVAGNPAKIIMSLEDYYNKRLNEQKKEAQELTYRYREIYKKDPDDKALDEFFELFSDGSNLCNEWRKQCLECGNYEKTIQSLKNNKREFKDKNDFLKNI